MSPTPPPVPLAPLFYYNPKLQPLYSLDSYARKAILYFLSLVFYAHDACFSLGKRSETNAKEMQPSLRRQFSMFCPLHNSYWLGKFLTTVEASLSSGNGLLRFAHMSIVSLNRSTPLPFRKPSTPLGTW